ncbi:MAG: hypothetical protein JSV44_03480 [Candidatus Zixiibacteriota bacterium]|nr:MAG: hypothetical protein JSV44_03480 [candidate division Zixibacteria bacterium]
MTPSRFRWGLLLITIGVILLLNNAGHVAWDYWWELTYWWPILLIAIGFEKIFRGSKLHLLSYLSPLILVAGMVYVAVETGPAGSRGDFFSSYRWSQDFDPDVKLIDAVVNHGGNDLHVRKSSVKLISGRFGRFLNKPQIEYSVSDGVASLDVERGFRRRGRRIIIGTGHFGKDWGLAFSKKVPLRLTCIGDESEMNLQLQDIPVKALTLDNDDGDLYVKIGSLQQLVGVSVKGDNAELRMVVPEGCGLEISGDEYARYFETLGLIDEGSVFRSSEFDSASVRVTIDVDAELRHFSVDFY